MGEAATKPIVLVAMGGHAFMQKGEKGTIEEHERNAEEIARLLMTLVEKEYHLVISHGNGPQVGALLLQQESADGEIPQMPLDVLVAMTEGSLGYILQQNLLNQLRKKDVRRYVVTVVTQVLVDGADPAFAKPTKPIGPFLSKEEAERRRDKLGWSVKEDAGRGWRRLVPSPHPLRVVQRHMIRDAVRAGHIVVACGGGGIPIKKDASDQYVGVEAVIDKDLTSSVLASDIGAALFIILTAVPQVYLDFGTPKQRALGAVTLDEIESLMAEGHFPPGSMGPKIEAVINFLKAGGRRALITNPESLPLAIEGRAGTHVVGRI
ncbi:MAG TPA: carbamate kinase [Candidatus Polarisedimenticolaceae bacterium]|nr:carbamate kinase [Candidatus Polarisedimenticolaceae bacterium]